MTMDLPTHRKYYLKNRHLYLLSIILVFALNVKAGNTDTPELEIYNNSFIQDITYTYNLFSEDQKGLDCYGVLDLSISLPINTKTLIFERTKPHITNPDLNKLHFIVKSELPNTVDLTIPNIYWGTYFRICAILIDGTRLYSSIYSINEYINHGDLDFLLKSSSIEEMYIDDVSLYIKNKKLYVNTPDTLSLSIYDLYGNQIFSGDIYQAKEIYLNNINSPFIIATYRISNITKTRKILVQ